MSLNKFMGMVQNLNGFHFFMPINLSVDWNQAAKANKNITGLSHLESYQTFDTMKQIIKHSTPTSVVQGFRRAMTT